MTLDQWLLISVPIVAGVFALIGSWLGSRLGRSTEHQQWLRNQKQAAYSELLGAFDVLYLETGRPQVDVNIHGHLFSLVTKQSRLSVVAPSRVRALSDRLVDQAWEMVQAARGVGPDAGERFPIRTKARTTADELIDAIRADLAVSKPSED
jgi:hypothetical protein